MILARCVCKKHGKISLKDIVIIDNIPRCKKCSAQLDFGEIRPKKR